MELKGILVASHGLTVTPLGHILDADRVGRRDINSSSMHSAISVAGSIWMRVPAASGDFYDRPIELLEDERVERRLEGVLLQLALQVLNGNLLTDRQPLVAVRAEVDAGEVAAQGGVRGELPLLSDSFKGSALFGRPRQLLLFGRVRVQHCLEDRDACPRDGGVPCGPRRVSRASLGVLRREEQRLVARQSTSEG
eukprot:scaffold54221_cov55-Phaeocystis_antarctica.AAC.2